MVSDATNPEDETGEAALDADTSESEQIADVKPSKKKAFIAIGAAVVVALIVFGFILPQLVDWKLVGEAIRSASLSPLGFLRRLLSLSTFGLSFLFGFY